MNRIPSPWIVPLLISLCSVLLGIPRPASAASDPACSSAIPDSILPCLERIYAARDIEALRTVLAPDFEYRFGESAWGMERELAATRKMFQSDSTKSIALTFSGKHMVKEGPTPGTWIVSGITSTMAIDAEVEGTGNHYEVANPGVEIWLRLVPDPAPHLLIYRWVASDK